MEEGHDTMMREFQMLYYVLGADSGTESLLGVPQTSAGKHCPPSLPSPGLVTFSAVPLCGVCPPVLTMELSPLLDCGPLQGITTAAHPCVPGTWHRAWYPDDAQ